MKNVGLLIIATNKYDIFVKPLIESAKKYFLKNQNVTFYIFTDSKNLIDLGDNVKILEKVHEPWPLVTLHRYKTFVSYKEILKNEDYLFYCDSDMLFVDEVGDEILEDSVSTVHPGFQGSRGTPETNPNSLAYIDPNEKLIYFAGGFNGGSSFNFLNMSEIIDKNIDEDMGNGIIAIWHDESHMNRYFIDNPPKIILSPSYCYPESWNIPFEKKLLALDKNHKEIRGL